MKRHDALLAKPWLCCLGVTEQTLTPKGVNSTRQRQPYPGYFCLSFSQWKWHHVVHLCYTVNCFNQFAQKSFGVLCSSLTVSLPPLQVQSDTVVEWESPSVPGRAGDPHHRPHGYFECSLCQATWLHHPAPATRLPSQDRWVWDTSWFSFYVWPDGWLQTHVLIYHRVPGWRCVLEFVISLQQHSYLKYCIPQVLGCPWYWVSGDCCCTTWQSFITPYIRV